MVEKKFIKGLIKIDYIIYEKLIPLDNYKNNEAR